MNSDNQTPQQPQLQPQLLKYSQARPTSTGSTLPRKVVTNESAGDDFEIFSFLANDVSLGHEFKDDITSLLDDSLIDMKNSAPSSPSHFEKLAQGREVKPQEPVGLLQKMAEFDEANSDIFSDLILGNNYPKTSVLDSPNLSTANSTPTNVAGHTSTPESLILYGNGNNNSANSSVGQAAKYADQEKNNINLTLSDFESSGESTDNIDPRRVKLTSKGSASPADLFEFEVNKSSTSVSSLSNMNDMKSPKAISDLSKFKKLLPPNSPIVKSERRNSGGQLSLNPLSPNKVSKSTFSKSLVAPIRPYGVDNSRPRSPSNSKRPGSKQNDTLTSPANSIRKVKSTLNTHALSSSNLTNGNVLSTMKIKPQNPKARRTFSFNQCSSTLDFSKNYMAPATGDANLGNCNKLGAGNEVNGNALPMQGQQNIAPTPPSNFKVYSFVIDPHTTSSVSESHQKEKMSGLSLNINTGHEMPGHNMMVPSDLISPTLSLKSPNLESPMMHTPLSATFPGHFPLGKGTSYIDNTIKPSKKLKNMESGMTEFQLKLKKI